MFHRGTAGRRSGVAEHYPSQRDGREDGQPIQHVERVNRKTRYGDLHVRAR